MFVQSVAQGQLPFGKGWKEGFRSGSKVSSGGRKAGRGKWKGQETPDAGEGSHARRKGEGGRGRAPAGVEKSALPLPKFIQNFAVRRVNEERRGRPDAR